MWKHNLKGLGVFTRPRVLLTCGRMQNPLCLPRKTTSERPKVLRTWCFVHFHLEMCFAPQWHALFRRLNFQKCSEPGVFCSFWLGNVLRATTACTFSTSQLPKVLWMWGVLSFFTCKRQRHALFRHLTFQECSEPGVCFVHFDFDLCFAPQRRAILISHLAYFSTLRSHKSLEKQIVLRLFYLFAHLHLLILFSLIFSLLSSLFFSLLSSLFSLLSSSLLFCSLLFSSLTLPTPACPSSILSEVRLLKFLRLLLFFLLLLLLLFFVVAIVFFYIYIYLYIFVYHNEGYLVQLDMSRANKTFSCRWERQKWAWWLKEIAQTCSAEPLFQWRPPKSAWWISYP